ncbi:non-ribosomal peptide synthetase [Pseudomonas syringae group sp. 243L2]|nr:non-ribosomal peptide synthetase [Pseudomonas syringae group sp. 243L2]MDU8628163.1 amino acid adenylation domain-containing protein [Pseudomonas syringae group sp. 243L2]
MTGTTAARIAKRFVGLPLEQRQQFLARLRQEGKDFSLLPVPVSRHDFSAIPLSFAQQRLLFLWQLDPQSDAYKMTTGLRLQGPLNESALRRAFDHLIERHEVLRTVFHTDGDQAQQVLLHDQTVALDSIDLSGLADVELRDAELALRVITVTSQPFDLRTGPLLRAHLFRLASDEHVLVVSMHHIVSDGWSMDVMIQEFVHCYQAYCEGREPALPELPLQYADYAIWQRSWLEAGEGARQLDYWRSQLGDEQPLLDAAQDFPRPVTQSYQGEHLRFDFGADLSRQLNAFARTQGMTLFMLVLAGFSLFLSRKAGQRDIRIGVPNANRGRAETEGLIGFFINTQVLRCQVDERLSYLDLLAQIRDTSFGAQAHQDVPFEQLVDQLAPERSLGHNPLFQAKFNQNVILKQKTALKLAGLEVSEYAFDKQGAHFDLALDITDDGTLIHGDMAYASDLYRRATVEGFIPEMLALFKTLLDAPQAPLFSLGALAIEPPRQVREAAPQVLQLWDQQVRTQPDALAARCLDRSLTTLELDQAANQLAHHLIRMGIGEGQPVAVLMERSLDWLTAVLAIFKAGGVYMPLDVKAPDARLQQMLCNAEAKLLLCAEGDVRKTSLDVAGCEGLAWTPALWQDLPVSRPDITLSADSAAYVIHTSGSTGQPKGVLVSQGALASYVRGLLEQLQLAPEASMALVSTIAADLGHTVLFGALCSGRTLHVLTEALGFDPDAFAAYMAEHQVGVLKIVPGHLAALLQASQPADVLPQHALIVGGEACSPALVEQVRQLKPDCRVINHYGPSETTVGVLTHELKVDTIPCGSELVREEASTGLQKAEALPPLSRASEASPGSLPQGLYLSTKVPVGAPLPGASAYVLDDVLNPVGTQVAGELYIGGDSVALGYIGQPALTAERFVPDPFAENGARAYRSGDRMRRNHQGLLEFIGRADDQVKVRGYRVEPAEVARVLLNLPSVAQASVLALPVDEDESRLQLVAYCVAAAGASLTVDNLREQLAARLPDYMVPAQIMLLDSLPLTANGKLDKRALPKPGVVKQRYTAPVGEIEEKLAAVWADVLKLEQVGSTDNFFELGGDSILSLQIIARAKRQGIKLSPKQLFEKQTISQLASVAKLIQKKPAAPVEQISGSLPLLPIQARFFELDIPERQHWNQALMLKPLQTLDAIHLQAALTALIEQHDALRLGFTQQDGQWQATFGALNTRDLLWIHELDSIERLPELADEAQRSLDLKNGPLLRAVLIDLPQGEQRLLLVIHHLVVDGVSWRVLLEDLQQAYVALTKGQLVALAAKTTSLKHWAEQLQQHATGETLTAERDYWLHALQGADQPLPRDKPEGSMRNRDAAHASSWLSKDLTHKLLKVAPAAYRTQVNDLLLTALAQVLCEWSQQPSVLIQLEGHGREDLFDDTDLSRTVGWFSSLFPVRLTPQIAPGASLCGIKEQLRAVPNKGIGYGVLRHLGEPSFKQQLAALPQARVTFNYLGQFDGSFNEQQGALFMPSADKTGTALCEDGPLGNWLSLNGQVFDGQLQLDWSFSREVYHASTIDTLARRYEQALTTLIDHCTVGHQGVTPSDFPLARLTQTQLDGLPIAAGEIEDIYPLSPMQQGMLFHSLFDESAGNYINQMRVSISGLDVPRFHNAWQSAVNNHEVLRSCFISQSEQSLQVVQRQVTLPFVELDARGKPQNWLDDWAQADRQQGFDLAHGPLLRLAVVRTGDDAWQLVYTSHHILMDGWSSSRLLGEVLQRYSGETPPKQAGRYRDYIQWLQDQDADVSERFWTAELAELDEPTRLLQAFKTSTDQQGYGDYIQLIDADGTRRLSEFAREQHVTLNTLVQSAWLLLLQRYTGQSSVTFGATVAGRPAELPGVEEQLGLFINTLPVIASPRSEQTVGDWVQQVQAKNIALREHEHTPLYDIQRWARNSGEALFDNILVFENYPVSEALQRAPDGLTFSDLRNQEQAHYPLTLVVEANDVLSVRFSYDRQHFSAEGILQLAAHFDHLLQSLSTSATARLGELTLPTAWTQSVQHYPTGQCAHQRIETQAERTPLAIALTFAGEQLSYQQLNSRANQLAHKLREQGVGPDVRVGLAAERSLDMIVGMLAILKAGGAYVPLDPDYPQDRLSFLMQDSGIELLLNQAHLLGQLPIPAHVQTLDLADSLDGYSTENPVNQTSPDNLAYVIYTSGSTGKPKGTLLAHHNLMRLFAATNEWFAFNEKDVWTLFHSFAFDFSVWEIFGALLHGGRLVIVPREVTRSPEEFHALLVEQQVTVLNQTPSAFKQLMRVACDSPVPMSLEKVIFGGEALDVASLKPWFDRFGDQAAQLINMYGITETTVHVTYRPITEADTQNPASPIGEAIPDLSWYVLDADFNPVAQGCSGELHIGHAGLARGYHNRAALTAERFVPDPFSSDGGRLYRTGDLARYRAAGVIEYAGRIDHQVKIRGFRIELGEIEARLQAHPTVREVIVLAVDGRLAAYLVPAEPDQDQQSLRETLKTELRAHLPDYMVPTHFIVLDKMPLTANGKLDRKALPAPDASQLQATYIAPQGDLEQQLAAIWADVLKVEQVGRSDNFFELGGHSLLATQVISRIRQQLDVELSLRDLFEARDLAAFAQAAGNGQGNAAPRFIKADRSQPLGLSYAQQRQWFLWQLDPESTAYTIPAALRLSGSLDIAALEHSFSALIARHETLRTTFRQQGEQAVQIIHAPRALTLMVESVPAGQPLEACVEQEMQRPFDLEKGPLLRVRLLNLAADEHVLILTQHHIVSDGWSMPIMVDELVRLYEGYSQGREVVLTALDMQYADYALWQRNWMDAGEQARQLDYWKQQLGEQQPILELPADHPRPVVQSHAGARLAVELAPALIDDLKQVARQQGVTLFMLLLASFQTLLHRHSGQSDIRVGVPIANRTRAETEGLIGFFVNTQVLRAEFDLHTTFSELLQQVKQAALQAQAHQELPFEQLVEALQPQRSLSHSPLFQVMFNHQSQASAEVRALPGLQVEALTSESYPAQFDLTLNTAEHDGGLSAGLTYATALFERSTIERMAGHWLALLQAICANAGQRIAEVPMLDAAEQQQIVRDWNATAADFPGEHCLHSLIEAQVQATPDAPALIFAAEQLSYAQLNARANQLAHRLREAGVGPDVLVGICVERSLELVIGLLAIIKAGGAYVPLDPDYPEDRLAYMMQDSGIGLLLTQSALLQGLPVQVQSLCLDQEGDWLDGYSTANPINLSHPQNLAYVIYTSGSTGKPKGAGNSHRALVNRLHWMQKAYGLDGSDTVLQKTPFSFDVSVWEFFWPLMTGARLAVALPGDHRDPERLVQTIRVHQVTTLHFVPSMLQAFLTHPQVEGCNSLRRVVCSGEALPSELAGQVLKRLPQTGLFNLYGPTEAAIDVTHWTCTKDDVLSVPIGRPIDNLKTHILDDGLLPAAQGVAAELYLGGVGLARGYHNRAALTAERFVPDPFDEQGGRLYRTGDLARYRDEGVIEYAGRIDHQVKIRGLRIELGEIEASLLEHENVQEAVVVDVDGPSGKQLAAYLVAEHSGDNLRDALKVYLKETLPDYMVPTHFVWLASMPLSANGKLDRKALPAPDASQLQRQYVAPSTEQEQQMAAIWADVLKVERVGLSDDFFELGGHSLLATQLISRIQTGLGIDIPLRLIFEKPQLNEFIQAFASSGLSLTEDGLSDIEKMMNEMAGI